MHSLSVHFPFSRFFLLIGLVCLLCSPAVAGKYNSVLSIGDASPTWSNLPGTDEKKYSLKDFAEAEFVIVAFTCNSCPYAIDVEDRLNELHEFAKKKKGVLIAINVNKVAEDLPEAMKAKAKEKKFEFPYLFDESQKIAKDFGATTTPEFFVLDKQRKVAYMGSLDDSPDGKKISKQYLQNAINKLLAKEKIEVAETVPIGCRIRFDRKRRRRK